MSQPSSSSKINMRADLAPGNISEIVWQYMTSVKSVKKRDGAEENFDIGELQNSITAALLESGMNKPKLADKITAQIISRLAHSFDGHTTPTSSDIRELVNVTFIDHNLIHAAKKYMLFRAGAFRKSKTPVYGNGLTVERFFTKEGVHPFNELTWDLRDARLTN